MASGNLDMNNFTFSGTGTTINATGGSPIVSGKITGQQFAVSTADLPSGRVATAAAELSASQNSR